MRLTKNDKVLLLILALVLGSFALYSATRDKAVPVSDMAVLVPTDSLVTTSEDSLQDAHRAESPQPKKGFLTTDRYPGPPEWMTEAKETRKLSPGETLDLNLADTLDFLKVPGIGTSFSRRIYKYRKRLGGYYTKEQLQEVYGMDRERYDKIAPYLEVRTKPRPIYISGDSISRHPYLSYRQMDVLMHFLQRRDSLTWQALMATKSFTTDDSLRLSPYLPIR